MNASFLLSLVVATTVHASDYGNRVGDFPLDITAKLAEANAPNASGAIGRNKNGYFHVRFQRGMHHVADHALASKQPDIVDSFLMAAEYALQRQLPSGDFELLIPETMRNQGKPSVANRASGVAFFVSSLGLGLRALETNDWFKTSSECEKHRSRLSAIRPKLRSTLRYLIQHERHLEAVDRQAPNRLLFDALAYTTFGEILNDDEALEIGSAFADKALVGQRHFWTQTPRYAAVFGFVSGKALAAGIAVNHRRLAPCRSQKWRCPTRASRSQRRLLHRVQWL